MLQSISFTFTDVFTHNKEENELKSFYQALSNAGKSRLGEKLRVFLTHARADTRLPLPRRCSSQASSSPSPAPLPFSAVSPHPAHSFRVLRPTALSLTRALIMKCVVCCCAMRTESRGGAEAKGRLLFLFRKPGSEETSSLCLFFFSFFNIYTFFQSKLK